MNQLLSLGLPGGSQNALSRSKICRQEDFLFHMDQEDQEDQEDRQEMATNQCQRFWPNCETILSRLPSRQ